MQRMVLGVIVGNRDVFPDVLVGEGRKEMLTVLSEMGIEAVILDDSTTKLGAVETWKDAQRCAELFRANKEGIDGILVTLPNFGDEKGVADSIRLSGLDVPVLVHAHPDRLDQLGVERRRDALCGKLSVCSNLNQYGIRFSLTEQHTVGPSSESFRDDLSRFVAVCRVVRGLRRVRLGAIGARPNAFNTTRYSEKLLEASGISVATIDLSEILGSARKIADGDLRVRQRLAEIKGYISTDHVPDLSLVLMAKLAIVISDWMEEHDLAATAIQCWTSLQLNYGVNVCTVMSMLSEKLMPSACEVDVTGSLAMYALQLASGTPSALVDWNNNYGDDPDKCILFHCGNWPRSLVPEASMACADILGSVLSAGMTYGTVSGRTPAGPLTYARITTDDRNGRIRTYVGEGSFTDDPLSTFGSRAVVKVPNLQKLFQYICRNGFEHHVAVNASSTAGVLAEAFGTYMGWDVYHHAG